MKKWRIVGNISFGVLFVSITVLLTEAHKLFENSFAVETFFVYTLIGGLLAMVVSLFGLTISSKRKNKDTNPQ